jgi:acyl-coenzyme A thioesterase PaaI-like protein
LKSKAIQDYYPDDVAHCYGCGKLNKHGYRIKTYLEEDDTVTRYTPEDYHTAIPGYVYGGLIASLIDCHGTGTAAIVSYIAERREPGTTPPFRYVTASLNVEYMHPTPLGAELELRGRAVEITGKKVVSEITVSANGKVTARGKVVAVRMPDNMVK